MTICTKCNSEFNQNPYAEWNLPNNEGILTHVVLCDSCGSKISEEEWKAMFDSVILNNGIKQ